MQCHGLKNRLAIEVNRPYLTDRPVARQAALAEPWEMASRVRDALKTKQLDRFALNVRDCFIYGIGSMDQT